ncbi:MAG: hypothetical protein HUU20_03805 [Pirellulales bacterium]|nr:hypothetical protein [Pirellulales bacterium]
MKVKFLAVVLAMGLPGAVQQSFAQKQYDIPVQTSAHSESQAAEVAAPEGCADGQSGTCEEEQCGDCETYSCVDPSYQPCWRFYGDFLFLRARDTEVPYAVPIDGPIGNPFVAQAGRVVSVDPDYEPGFRIGGSFMLDCDAALSAQYTWWRSDTEDAVSVLEPLVLRSLVSSPAIENADSDGLDAAASYDIEFQLADIDYRSVFYSNGRTSLTWLAGVSYAHLEEDFVSVFGVNGLNIVESNVQFDGAGIRLGLEAERYARNCGLLLYGRSSARFVAGEFDADYFQGEVPGDPVQIDTGWDAGRIVSILDLELGIGWQSCDGCLRLTGGYMVSGWFNTVSTADWIAGVQANDFGDLDDTISFDGFTARAEVRW